MVSTLIRSDSVMRSDLFSSRTSAAAICLHGSQQSCLSKKFIMDPMEGAIDLFLPKTVLDSLRLTVLLDLLHQMSKSHQSLL